MRVTVSHNKNIEEVKRVVNDYTDQIFGGMPGSPIQIVDQQKTWNGSTMNFSFIGKMGIFSAPITGFVECTPTDVTVNVELPAMLKQFVPEEKIQQQVAGRVKGLLT